MTRIKDWFNNWPVMRKGGPGSGHRGHAGSPGSQGGSLPGSGGSWAHHGGEKDPGEYTGSAAYVRQDLLRKSQRLGEEATEVQGLREEAITEWEDAFERGTKLTRERGEAAKAGDVTRMRFLDGELDKNNAALKQFGPKMDGLNDAKGEAESRVRELGMKTLSVENPADFNVDFGRLKGGKKDIVEGAERFKSLVGTGTLDGETVMVKRPTYYGKNRAYYESGAIHIPAKYPSRNTTVHELGHWLEDRDPAVRKKALAFLERRTKGERAQKLSTVTGDKSYKDYELSRPDKFMDAYVGKDYGGKATEIVSMGFEYLCSRPIEFAKRDPEYFDFMYDLARGR